MRPLSLTLDGFRSYATAQTFDFRDRRLVGIVGPIGSGKSSILDAMAFALYGKTPTVERDTKGLINQRLTEARVELWFEVGGETWRAVRALRSKGQGAATLTRHAELDPESEKLDQVIGVREMTNHIERLLGLDFAGFTRSVLLAQNRFAEFLNARPGERDAVLKGVFGFDRIDAMQQAAKSRRDAAARDLEELQRRRKDIEADNLELEQTRLDLKAAQEREAALDAQSGPMGELQAEAATAVADEKATSARLTDLRSIAERFPSRERTERTLDAAEADAATRLAAEEIATAARAALDEAEAAVTAVTAAYGDRDALAAAEQSAEAAMAAHEAAAKGRARLDAAHEELAAAEAKLAATATTEAQATAVRDEAAAALGSAKEAVDVANAAWDEAQHAEMAHAVRTTLVAGEACPVCEQPVVAVPKGRMPAGLKAAEKNLDAARKAEVGAGTALESAGTALATTGRDRAAAEAGRTAATSLVADREAEWNTATALAGELAEVASGIAGDRDAGEYLAEWKQKLTAVTAAARAATDVDREAREAVDGARRTAEERGADLQSIASEIAGLSGRLILDLEPAAEPDALRKGLAAMRDAWQRSVAEVEAAAEAAAKSRQEIASRLGAILEEFDVATAADFIAALDNERTQVAVLVSKIEGLEQRVARVAELEQENAATVAQHDVFTQLAEDLLPSRFLNYLLDEERAELSHLGSDLFEMLSAERYRFTDDGSFGVVDLAAAERMRAAGSLSGGETFLASLALALALAEMVSRSGGRLDAFMLDEGFGALDPEHLDLAMQGIERLVDESSERLVIVVSHVPELRERCDDLIVLDKDPVTGNTVVRERAG